MFKTLRLSTALAGIAALALVFLTPGSTLLAAEAATAAPGGDKGHYAKKDKSHEKNQHGASHSKGHFDEKAMAAKYRSYGWTGLTTEKNEEGRYAVTEVASSSPAYQAGLRSGDVLLALNGIPLKAKNKKELKAAKAKLSVGDEVTYTVLRDGNKKQVAVALAPVPEAVLAQWLEKARSNYGSEGTQVAEKNR